MYKVYKYGGYRSEIKGLLRQRTKLKNKMRHHILKNEEIEKNLLDVESELDRMLSLAGN